MTKNACLALWFALVLGSGVRAQQADQQEKTEKQELEAAVAAAVATDATLSSGKEHASDRPVLHRRNPRYMLRAGDVLACQARPAALKFQSAPACERATTNC